MKKLGALLLLLLISSTVFAAVSLDSFQQLVTPAAPSTNLMIEQHDSGSVNGFLLMPDCARIQGHLVYMPTLRTFFGVQPSTPMLDHRHLDRYLQTYKPEFAKADSLQHTAQEAPEVYARLDFRSAPERKDTSWASAIFFIDMDVNAATCLANNIKKTNTVDLVKNFQPAPPRDTRLRISGTGEYRSAYARILRLQPSPNMPRWHSG